MLQNTPWTPKHALDLYFGLVLWTGTLDWYFELVLLDWYFGLVLWSFGHSIYMPLGQWKSMGNITGKVVFLALNIFAVKLLYITTFNHQLLRNEDMLGKNICNNILEIGFHFLFEKMRSVQKRATPSTPALWPTSHQTKEPICWKTEISTKWVIWCQLCFSKRGTALQIFTTQLVCELTSGCRNS